MSIGRTALIALGATAALVIGVEVYRHMSGAAALPPGGPVSSQLQPGDSFTATVNGQRNVFEVLTAADPATQTVFGLNGNTGDRQVIPLSAITATQKGV